MSEKIRSQLRALIAKRDQFVARIKNAYELIPNLFDESQRKTFVTRCRTIPETKAQLELLVDQINSLISESDPNTAPDFSLLNEIDDMFCQIEAAKAGLTVPQPPEVPVSRNTQLKLPKLELVAFSGNPLEWPIFFENFKNAIHENPNLSDAEKVRYLVGKVTGKALNVISGIPATADNYEVMWNSLIEKFEDKRKLALTYLTKMFNFRPSSQTYNHLEAFLEHFASAYEALKRLQISDLADFIVLHLASIKIDAETFKEFEMADVTRKSDFPTFTDFTQFVKEKIRVLERLKRPMVNTTNKHTPTQSFMTQSQALKGCILCKTGHHPLYKCSSFLNLSPPEREAFARKENVCYNCLSTFHKTSACKSESTCRSCHKRHNSLLHVDTASPVATAGVSLCNVENTDQSSVLLSTAVVKAFGHEGIVRNIRVLLDSASQPNLVSLRCARALGLKIEKFFSSALGIGGLSAKIIGKTNFSFCAHFSSTPEYNLEFFVVPKIADNLPRGPVDVKQLTHLKNLVLADAGYGTPGEIDAIVGAELYPFLVKASQVTNAQGSGIALDTALGFVVMGKVPNSRPSSSIDDAFCFFQSEPLETLVSKFWMLDNINTEETWSDEDKTCEDIFRETHRRDGKGRYVVNLPFKSSPSLLGDSWKVAERRFLQLEKKFARNPNLQLNYSAEIQKLIDNNYITSVDSREGYFIPHHPVLKPESSSTPVRVVFDASAKTDSGLSLNDILLVGPKLQTETSAVLQRFRLFSVALSADVRQMYLRILVNPEHTKFQKFIWRFHPNAPLSIYEITRVVFGVNSSPFLALRTIQQLSKDEGEHFPLAAQYIPADMYVDDLATSISEVDTSIQFFEQAIALFRSGGFELVKWATNNKTLLEHIPENLRKSSTVSLDPDQKHKILGLIWDPQTDSFSFNFQLRSAECTKRNILSTLARIFDPLGFLGPLLLHIKCMIKSLWELKLGWDDRPPPDFETLWNKIIGQLPSLSRVMIPRHLAADYSSHTIMLGFCDGSRKGYGAVVYLRTINGGDPKISLLSAKSRVSPLSKPLTIPQCELSGAWLLSRLLKSLMDSVSSRIKIDEIMAFSDSTITLSRIKSEKSSSEVFVRNRVTKIRECFPPHIWYYTSTKNNPADCLSRGLVPEELINHPQWWYGPSWLAQNRAEWPVTQAIESNIFEKIQVQPFHSFLVVKEENPIFILSSRCSTWKKFTHSVVFMLRFCKKINSKGRNVEPEDLEIAENFIFRTLQNHYFRADIENICKEKACSRHIQKLHPFLDNGLLRVGGRLKFSEIHFEQKHPILLPKSSRIVELLIQHYHVKFLHAGPHLLLSMLRQKFWILSCRTLVRKIFHRCLQCFKSRPKNLNPIMADLPPARVLPAPPFTHTGVDYAGPFFVTSRRGRGQRANKAYLCLFVCLGTKAVHLELAPDLSTSSFLNALKRFLSRRGHCQVLYSDQGTNFIGAKGQLDEIFQFMNSEGFKYEFKSELTKHRIRWRFNPPSAPHFGGLWEANIGAVKSHLKRVVGTQILSIDEFHTVLTQIEAILNSRPLTALSEDPSEPTPLTPSHFLTGRPLVCLPLNPVPDAPINRLSRPQLIDSMIQHFWRRWSREYLHTLQQRQKWQLNNQNIAVGSIVLLGTENCPPLQWPLGVVEEVIPGDDGVVRVAQIRTVRGCYKRPVTKIYPLPHLNE